MTQNELSMYLFVCPFVRPSVHPSIHPSLTHTHTHTHARTHTHTPVDLCTCRYCDYCNTILALASYIRMRQLHFARFVANYQTLQLILSTVCYEHFITCIRVKEQNNMQQLQHSFSLHVSIFHRVSCSPSNGPGLLDHHRIFLYLGLQSRPL